jgi:hypothetical protein
MGKPLKDIFQEERMRDPDGRIDFFLGKYANGLMGLGVKFSGSGGHVILTRWDNMTPRRGIKIIASIRAGRISMRKVMASPVRLLAATKDK